MIFSCAAQKLTKEMSVFLRNHIDGNYANRTIKQESRIMFAIKWKWRANLFYRFLYLRLWGAEISPKLLSGRHAAHLSFDLFVSSLTREGSREKATLAEKASVSAHNLWALTWTKPMAFLRLGKYLNFESFSALTKSLTFQPSAESYSAPRFQFPTT